MKFLPFYIIKVSVQNAYSNSTSYISKEDFDAI